MQAYHLALMTYFLNKAGIEIGFSEPEPNYLSLIGSSDIDICSPKQVSSIPSIY